MSFLGELIDLIKQNVTVKVVDAMCAQFGFDYDVDYKRDYDGCSLEELVAQVSLPIESYQYNNWQDF